MEKNKPFDSKTLVAIVLVAAFYFLWQSYLAKKYGTVKPGVPITNNTIGTTGTIPPPGTGATSTEKKSETTSAEQPETFTSFENQNVSVKLSSKGMGFSQIELKKFIDRDENLVKLSPGDASTLYELRLNEQPVYFKVDQPKPGNFVGTFENSEYAITREITFTDGYAATDVVKVKSKSDKAVPKISVLISEKVPEQKSKSFLFSSYDHQDFNIVDNNKSNYVNITTAKENINQDYNPVTLAGISTQYFTVSSLDQSNLLPSAATRTDISSRNAVLELQYNPVQHENEYEFKKTLYMGPKQMDHLTEVDPALSQLVNFGMLGVLARPMLTVMKQFHEWTLNWGLAIILLTILVRLVVLPFNVISYRSMKAMQKIQPLINSLKEKYKDDPMAQQREMMALMKHHKANPLSGCLPMLLQIPVFFTIYRVIGSSVELYRSPLGLWIQDLSLRDPYFILPVIMGITMFIQQKLTPNATMDPMQAKIMSFLPLVFSLFMLNLPSGLTLYMCVSAIFGITQQYIMLKQSKA